MKRRVRRRPPHLFTFGKLADISVSYTTLREAGVTFTGAPHLIYTDDRTGVEEWMAFFHDPSRNPMALMARVHPQT